MNAPVVCRLARGIASALVILVVGAGSANAVEIDFGTLTPTPGSCRHTVAADAGLVCNNGQTFTANNSTFVATGYSNAFKTTTALTLNPETSPSGPPTNSFAASGLGENGNGCCSGNLAVDGDGSIRARRSRHPIRDVIVGSVQADEDFQVYTGSSIATLKPFGGVIAGGTPGCAPASPGTATCEITGLSALVGGIQSAEIGNVVLTAVSARRRVPEPASLVVLGTALAGLAMMRRRLRS